MNRLGKILTLGLAKKRAWQLLVLAALLAALVAGLHAVWALELRETPTLAATHGELPPIAARVPADPLVVDLKSKGRQVGKHGVNIARRHPANRGLHRNPMILPVLIFKQNPVEQ